MQSIVVSTAPSSKGAQGKTRGQSQRDFPRAQGIFHSISQLGSHYRHSQLPNNRFATAVACAAVTAVATNEFPVLAVKLIASVEEILAAMVTHSHSNSHRYSH